MASVEIRVFRGKQHAENVIATDVGLLHQLRNVPRIPPVATNVGGDRGYICVVSTVGTGTLPGIVGPTLIPRHCTLNPVAVNTGEGYIGVIVARSTDSVHLEMCFNHLPSITIHNGDVGNVKSQQ